MCCCLNCVPVFDVSVFARLQYDGIAIFSTDIGKCKTWCTFFSNIAASTDPYDTRVIVTNSTQSRLRHDDGDSVFIKQSMLKYNRQSVLAFLCMYTPRNMSNAPAYKAYLIQDMVQVIVTLVMQHSIADYSQVLRMSLKDTQYILSALIPKEDENKPRNAIWRYPYARRHIVVLETEPYTMDISRIRIVLHLSMHRVGTTFISAHTSLVLFGLSTVEALYARYMCISDCSVTMLRDFHTLFLQDVYPEFETFRAVHKQTVKAQNDCLIFDMSLRKVFVVPGAWLL